MTMGDLNSLVEDLHNLVVKCESLLDRLGVPHTRVCKKLDTCPRIRSLRDMSEFDQFPDAVKGLCFICEDYE